MTGLGDLLDPADRARLDVLVRLAQAARDTASTSSGDARYAWRSVAAALNQATSGDDARERLNRILQGSPIGPLAQSCLAELLSSSTTTEGP
jgi:hypothetical protein